MRRLIPISKFALALAFLFLIWLNWKSTPTDFVKLEPGGTAQGIQAGMFALIAAAALFLTVIPRQQDDFLEKWARLTTSVAGSVAAALAAWFWLDSEAVNPGAYVYPIALVGISLVLMIVAPAAWTTFREWRDQRGKPVAGEAHNARRGKKFLTWSRKGRAG